MENNNSSNNKRIAKNTIYLYFRMLALMLIGLYTSRVVINALGVDDYGLYNVVGGFVAMLTVFNNLLAGGSSRFITYYLGLGDEKCLRQVFSACVTIHLVMGVLILLFGETFGLWFVNAKLNLDPARMTAANWVYQFSLLSTFLSVVQTPYTSAVIAHEKMSAFAYMTIFDVVAKLLVVFFLLTISYDRLIFYAAFYFLVNFVSICIYRFYCHTRFSECGFRLGYDQKLYREMFTYTGWNVIGAVANMANGQGVNVLLNIFFGTVVNTARGIAMNVAGIVGQFISNFQSSASPQIIKYYSAGDTEQMNTLISNTSKYATYIFL
ncbi:MAG: lipopolysaccharide biosynthesis protein, partial [Bacteroidaceae bacterium]|nr:lipopolysaccharide biosynthesis protein [Bacteroidaceae bacterium]